MSERQERKRIKTECALWDLRICMKYKITLFKVFKRNKKLAFFSNIWNLVARMILLIETMSLIWNKSNEPTQLQA